MCLKVCCFIQTIVFEFRVKLSGKQELQYWRAGVVLGPLGYVSGPWCCDLGYSTVPRWLLSVGKQLLIYMCRVLPKPVLAGSSSESCLKSKASEKLGPGQLIERL